jgi:outer membrane protein assembly factor BamD (BamD/ComL family)
MSSLKLLAMSASVVVMSLSAVRADTIWIGDTPRDNIKVDGVKIMGPKGPDRLGYMTDQGMNTSSPFSKLQRINIDGETSFNAAEDAYANKDYDTAITDYQSLLQSSSKDWMQTRAAMRLIQAGKAKNRYDAQVSAYVTLLEKAPEAAAQNKPSQPPEHSPDLDAALASISKALDDSSLGNPQKSALLNLQLQIDQARGDTAASQATLKQLVALGGASDAMKATIKLGDANVAYQSKEYPQAIADIEQNKALFTDPDQQVEALFVLAQSKYAVDGDKTDPDVLKDLALNYIRVVTFGSQLEDKPHVAESLDKAAEIEVKLKDPAAAVQLYQQLLRDKAHSSEALQAKAQAAIAHLGK